MRTLNDALNKRIDELLEEKHMTRYRLAMNSGLPHSTLKNIASDQVKVSRLSTIIMIASGFDMTVSEFLNSPLFDEDNLNL